MGNAVSGPAVRVQAGALDSYVSELGPDLYYDKRLAFLICVIEPDIDSYFYFFGMLNCETTPF